MSYTFDVILVLISKYINGRRPCNPLVIFPHLAIQIGPSRGDDSIADGGACQLWCKKGKYEDEESVGVA